MEKEIYKTASAGSFEKLVEEIKKIDTEVRKEGGQIIVLQREIVPEVYTEIGERRETIKTWFHYVFAYAHQHRSNLTAMP